MNDIEILEQLKEKAKNRDLGINSINYYYALSHALEILKEYELKGDKVYIRGNLNEFVAKD
jgi:hypothetical protein